MFPLFRIESSEVTNVSCFGNADGAISINALTGGLPPYYFLWSTGEETQNIFGLQVGTYEVTVSGSAGCQTIETFTVDEPTPIEITNIIITDATSGNADWMGQPSVDWSQSTPKELTQLLPELMV